jgi:hypothetical protein
MENRKGLFYDASVLPDACDDGIFGAAFEDMNYMHYVTKKQGNFLDIDTDGELFVAGQHARLFLTHL